MSTHVIRLKVFRLKEKNWQFSSRNTAVTIKYLRQKPKAWVQRSEGSRGRVKRKTDPLLSAYSLKVKDFVQLFIRDVKDNIMGGGRLSFKEKWQSVVLLGKPGPFIKISFH